MTNNQNLNHPLIAALEDYGETSIELLKLKAVDKGAGIASATTSGVVQLVFILLFVLMCNVTAALWIGELLGKNYLGFLVVTGFNGIVLLIVFMLRGTIKLRLNDFFINQILNK